MKQIKRFDILDGLMLFFGLCVAYCYGVYLGTLISTGRMPREYILPICVLLLVFLPTGVSLIFKRKMTAAIPRIFLTLKIIFVSGMALYTVCFSIFAVSAVMHPHDAAAVEKADAVIVFGCRVHGYEPSQRLQERLDAALSVLEEYEDSVCVVSGGKGEDETVSEAEVMRAYLEEHGIAPERIVMEERATSTAENLSYSMAVLAQMDLPKDAAIVGISGDYHAMRIDLLAKQQDVALTTVGIGGSGFVSLHASLVREFMAYVQALIFHT